MEGGVPRRWRKDPSPSLSPLGGLVPSQTLLRPHSLPPTYPIPHFPCLALSTNPVVLVPLLPASIVESTYLEESSVFEDSAIELGSQTPDSSFLV